MKRLIERFSDRTRDARCSRLTLPNFPMGRHNCLIIVFSCPVKRCDSVHPEIKTGRMFSCDLAERRFCQLKRTYRVAMGSNVQFVLKRALTEAPEDGHSCPSHSPGNASEVEPFAAKGIQPQRRVVRSYLGQECPRYRNYESTLPLQGFKVLRGESGDLK